VAVALLLAAPALAQQTPPAAAAPQGGEDAAGLAKQLANPVASLVSVPFQENWDYAVGPEDDTRFLLNFQPVMPFSINKDWNLIARVIVPILAQPALTPGGEAAFGLSDILFSAFFSPAQPRGAIWGVGPAMQLPVSSEPTLGTEKWAIGPTAVILKQSGEWTVGGLANHLWSYAGADDRSDVNQTFLQPFAAYTTKTAVTYTISSESTANWEAPSGEEWTIPINFLFSKVVRLGRRPMSVGIGAGYYVETPFDAGPEWKLRTILTLLFPR
jgi:hypothetical protein